MIGIGNFIKRFSDLFPDQEQLAPWEITEQLATVLQNQLALLSADYVINDGIAVHKTATIETNVVLKAPVIIGQNCFIGANAYLRGPVFLDSAVKIGPGAEIKQSIIFSGSAVAHFNYIGNSIVGSGVNFEAGSVAANHYNERPGKKISVFHNSRVLATGVEKFGALVGDGAKIGANAVLSPGTVLSPGFVVKRLELVDQYPPGKNS